MKNQDNWHPLTQRLALTCLLFAATCHSRATTIQWINSTGGNWSVATNWSPAQVPGPADIAQIRASGVYAVTFDADASIAGLTIGAASGTQTFTLAANALTLNGDCVVNANGQFLLSGGTLSGTNTLTGTMEWTGGTIGSNAVVTVGSNAVVTVTGQGGKGLAGTLRNVGTVRWQSAGWWNPFSGSEGYLSVEGGMIHNLAGGVFALEADSVFFGGAMPGGAFLNEGVLQKTGGTGTFFFGGICGLALANRGSVDVESGKLELQDGGSGSGTFNVETNCEVVFGAGYAGELGTALNGPGRYGFKGGTNAFVGEFNISRVWVSGQSTMLTGNLTMVHEMDFSNGTWLGTNRIEGVMSWTGGTIGSDAVVTVGSNAVLTIGSGFSGLVGTLRNAGTVLWQHTNTTELGSSFQLHGGTVENLASGLFDVQSDVGFSASIPGVFANDGLLQKTAGTGTFSFGVGTILTNRGRLDVQSGTLQVENDMQITSSSALSFGLRGTNNFGRITLSGSVPFTGRLCATLLDGFLPATNDVFEVMTFGSRSGNFTDTSCLDLGSGIQIEHQFTPTTLRLVMTNSSPVAGILQFGQGHWSIAESAGAATITVTRAGGSAGAVGVSFTATGGTATSESDFTLAPGTLQWADGEAGSKTFTVTILNDALPEGDETVILSLSTPTGGASLGPLSNATLTILDDESAIVSAFDSDADGWVVVDLPATTNGPFTTVVGGPYTPLFSATGGNPGGYIYEQDPTGNAFYFQAPARHLGNQSAAYGANLTYDQWVITTNNNLREIPDVVLVSGSTALVYQASANPGSNWTSFSVPLLESVGWHVGSLSGPAPTQAEFQAILASLTALRIRGEYSPTPFEEITALDNVVLNLSAPSCVAAPFGLVGWWPADTNGDDFAGGHHGQLWNGAQAAAPGFVAGAFQFDGVDDCVDLGTNLVLGSTFTEAAWIYSELTTNANRGIMGYDPTGDSLQFAPGLGIAGERILAAFGDGARVNMITTPPVLISNAWNHVAVTFDGTNYSAYANGLLVFSTNEFAGRVPWPTPVRYLGRVSTYFAGKLDEAVTFNRALSPSEVRSLYLASSSGICKNQVTPDCVPAPAGLIGWWPGDANGTDIVGGRTAAFRGGATNGLGLGGEAFVLDGISSFMEVADAPALNFDTSDFTVALWANFDSTAGEQALIEKYIETYTPAAPGWGFSKLADNSLIFGTHGLQLVHTAPVAIGTNTWMHFVARRGGGVGAIFTNGVLAATGTFPYDVDSNSSLKFGHRGSPDDTPGSVDTRGLFLNGRIDEVALFARALSDIEVAAIHSAGSGGMCGSAWRFVSVRATNQLFTAELAGWPLQATLDIEHSTNLIHWQWLQSCNATNGSLWFTHPTATNGPVQFYRAVVK